MALIKIRRGLKASIPSLAIGEPGYCTDTKELFVGAADGNKLVGGETFLKLTGGTLTGALTLPSTSPTHPNHATNKAYVDNMAAGLDVKQSVLCVATAHQDITMSGDNMQATYNSNGLIQIDGVSLVDDYKDRRILLVGQNNMQENGIYFLYQSGSTGSLCSLIRTDDAVEGTLTGGAFTFVEQGTLYADTGWVCTTDEDPITLGSTMIMFTQFTGAGSSSFVSLVDTPSSFSGHGGKVVTVAPLEGGLEFVDPFNLGRTTFKDLTDTPSMYGTANYLVKMNAAGDALDYISQDDVGRKTFLTLNDTPSSFEANKVPAVNLAGNALIWVTKESLGFQKIESFGDFAGVYGGNRLRMLRVNAAAERLEYFDPDLIPDSNHGDVPIASAWASEHQDASQFVHGAPSGSNLLHEGSTIDGGTW
jgi:hypothetical protein